MISGSAIDLCGESKGDESRIVIALGAPNILIGDPPALELLQNGRIVEMLPPAAGTAFDVVGEQGGTRLLVVGGGPTSPTRDIDWQAIGGLIGEALRARPGTAARLPSCATLGAPEAFANLVLGILTNAFQMKPFDGLQAKLFVNVGDLLVAKRAAEVARVLNQLRTWVAAPPNQLTPSRWCDAIAERLKSKVGGLHVLDSQSLEDIGANALLAVGRGSEDGSKLLIVEVRGDRARTDWDVAYVGKGLTFDSGGLNLKTRPSIAKMKIDMAGGAAVLGAAELAMGRGSRLNLVVAVAIAENSVDARSVRPGDVVRSLSGINIEVVDTDAEGRLALADAMTYVLHRYAPPVLIDAATLTTAVMDVLHEEFAGLYTNDERLAEELLRAGERTGEKLWKLPLTDDQEYLVESEIADLKNVGKAGYFGRGEGSPTAGAQFLKRFAGEARWAHIDLCGVAWATRNRGALREGPTGYGARLLDSWLSEREREITCLRPAASSSE